LNILHDCMLWMFFWGKEASHVLQKLSLGRSTAP